MEWNADQTRRLFELYERHIERLRTDTIRANHVLGSHHPERTWLKHLPRDEFESLVNRPTGDPEVVHAWLRRIVRGNEDEFPALAAPTVPHSTKKYRRNTGT